MALSVSAASERRRFRIAVIVMVALIVLVAVLLQPVFPRSLRQNVSALGLLVAGILGVVSAVLRCRRTRAAHRRPWLIIATAGAIAVLGNAWTAVTKVNPVTSSSLVSDASIAAALVLLTVALLTFPSARRRGSELVVMVLDGLVAGGALLIIASVLIYSELLDASTRTGNSSRFFALLFPVLDVVLATVSVLLVVRAMRADRLTLGLAAAGFLIYAAADLTYAVRVAQGSFQFGTVLDLGWIAGWLALVLAAWVPLAPPDERRAGGLSDALGSTLVFAVLLVAGVVQIAFGDGSNLQGAQAVAWIVVILAAGTRQIVLTSDNAALRRSLERRVAEQTADLRRLGRQNEVLLTSVGDGIYGVDHGGNVTFVNPSAAAALGYTMAELDGRPAHEMFHAPAEDGSPFPPEECYIHEAIASGMLASAEEDVYVRADGSTLPVEITASPLLDDTEVRGAVVVFRDMTQRREVDRIKNEFLSVVSHELRTPLTSIQGSLGLLASGRLGALPPRAGSLVAGALQSSERLTRLIDDILDIERIGSGTQPIELMEIDASALLHAAARQIEGMAGSAGVRVEVGPAIGRVRADRDRIMQTLINLLGNAIKFSGPEGLVRLDASELDGRVLISVVDNGRGIPADKLEAIFERFEQVDSSDARQQGGTGLGLAISRGIVHKHGGEIWAESVLGVGSTLHFTLPAAHTPTTVGGTDRTGMPTVLVCDDDLGVVNALSALLRAHGYRPIGATDGARAIALVDAEHPAAVLLDLTMPAAAGVLVFDALRSNEHTQDIPVMVICGLGPEADGSVAVSAREQPVEPVSNERLVRAVGVALTGRERESSVLFVADDEALAGTIATMLSQQGLVVRHTTTASGSLVLAQESRPDVIVLDIDVPGRAGYDAVAEFRRCGVLEHTPLILFSADGTGQERPGGGLADRVVNLVDAVTTAPGTTSPGTTRREAVPDEGARHG